METYWTAVTNGGTVRPLPQKQESHSIVGLTDRRRNAFAIAIREDGSRVPVRMPTPFAVTLLNKLELLVLGLVALITGSRRESGGRRR
jgi:hypothetical protein